MKSFFKKYAVPIVAVVCVLALCGAWTGVRLSANAGTYRLDDIEGDRAYLDGIRIDMSLFDTAHTQSITLDNGMLSHSYEYTLPFHPHPESSYTGWQSFAEAEDAHVKVEMATTLTDTGEDYELWTTHMTRSADKANVSVSVERIKSGPVYWAQVVTGVTVSGEGYPFTFNLEREATVYTNQTTAQGDPLPDTTNETPFSYTQTEVDPVSQMGYSSEPLVAEAEDGTVYFTPSLMPYYGGTSAIYRVDEWGGSGYAEEPAMLDGYPTYSDYNARSAGNVAKLASFPVDGHQLRTVALDVVGDRLCLLLVADGTLTLRVYGLDGAFEHELPLFEMNPELTRTSTLFTNESGSSIMLCYYLQDPGYASYWDAPPESGPKLLCVRLDDTAELMSVLTGHDTLVRAAFIGSHWVLTETEYVDYSYGDSSMIPQRHYISVLDVSGAVLYRGEIVTDQHEDEIQDFVQSGAEPPYDLFVCRWLSFDDITEG